MTDITIRNPEFDFSGPLDMEIMPGKPDLSAFQHGLSMTMPYLEPYLIRTMRTVMKELPDGTLKNDVRNFCGQEGNHYRNHMAMNDAIRAALPVEHANRLTEAEAALEADYQRFTKEKPLKYNVTYAEGFEAMTFAITRTGDKKSLHSFVGCAARRTPHQVGGDVCWSLQHLSIPSFSGALCANRESRGRLQSSSSVFAFPLDPTQPGQGLFP